MLELEKISHHDKEQETACLELLDAIEILAQLSVHLVQALLESLQCLMVECSTGN